jgi:hypothetical protein
MAIGGYCFGKVQELTELQCVVRSVIFMLIYVFSFIWTNFNEIVDKNPIKTIDKSQSHIHEPAKAF